MTQKSINYGKMEKHAGVFQFESQGMKNFMQELKPDCLEDLIAGVSLYRPGPMDQIPRYVRGKQTGKNEYTHPSLEPILNVTYGCMVYQGATRSSLKYTKAKHIKNNGELIISMYGMRR